MTGQSKMYANRLVECLDQVFRTRVEPFGADSFGMLRNLTKKENNVVFIITSTTGDGDPPHHAIAFQNEMEDAMKVGAKILTTKYAVFALGSSNYRNFCSFGIFIDEGMEALGGQKIVPCGLGDELKGQDRAFRTWTKAAMTEACSKLDVEMSDRVMENWPFSRPATQASHKKKPTFRRTKQVKADLVVDVKKNMGLLFRGVDLMKTVLVNKKKMSSRYTLLTFGFPDNPNIKLQAGDHIQVCPQNDPAMVTEIIEKLVEVPDKNELVVWNAENNVPPCTLQNALTLYLDIGYAPGPDIMLDWIHLCEDEAEKERLQNLCDHTNAYEEWREKRPNLLDFLNEFPSLQLPAAVLVGSLNKMMPRAYSTASVHPQTLSIGGKPVKVVDLLLEVNQFATGPFSKSSASAPQMRKGVTSAFLTRIPIGSAFLTYHNDNDLFRMPNDPNLPILMVCAGSGVAPFRAFWQERSIKHWPKEAAWLYFGCRDETENLFADETNKVVQRRTAFSRIPPEGTEKAYVQDKIEEDKDAVFDLISNQRAVVFICGQVAMADSVKARLTMIFETVGNMSAEESKAYLKDMKRNGRLVEEFFG